jgi:spoIIIJ-associated protein
MESETREYEFSARSVAEAIRKAEQTLGRTRDELDIFIVTEGRGGILGLGGEDARIRVRLRNSTGLAIPNDFDEAERELAAAAWEVVHSLLSGLGLEATVEVRRPAAGEPTLEPAPVTLNLQGDEVSVLIGRRGATLASFQFLVNHLLARRFQDRASVNIDIEDYRVRRVQSLKALALRAAQKVARTRRPVPLDAMPPAERRVIHLTLANHPDVTTQSTGTGDARRVVVMPRRPRGHPRGPARRPFRPRPRP